MSVSVSDLLKICSVTIDIISQCRSAAGDMQHICDTLTQLEFIVAAFETTLREYCLDPIQERSWNESILTVQSQLKALYKCLTNRGLISNIKFVAFTKSWAREELEQLEKSSERLEKLKNEIEKQAPKIVTLENMRYL
ncbi:hypothetical protein PVAG01_08056 [Phlyctema vagabunda]|uniref:Fungal N-terminal domain-containing protein n=1 Tax=Phlyctema vagabunda TaxID=108571 RepID=A0ABR4P8D5_9HELO